MALTSALFSGISGLDSLGNAMQIIGDNIANVNTVGFKGSTFTFQDLLSQNMSTSSGTSQVGRGTALSDIQSDFSQGSFETTGNTTDLAIGGDGFFAVRQAGSQNLDYTRAGNFTFDKNGNLVNPEGYIVQGWSVDSNGNITGSTKDIALTSFTSQPQATSSLSVMTNLDKDAISNSQILSSKWDGTADTPIDSSNYEYQTTVKAYDSLGSTHDITVYYDKLSGSNWQYIVTCNPSEDLRAGFAGTKEAGLLARGTISFNDASGTITGITMSKLTGDTSGADGTDESVTCTGATGSLATTDTSLTVNNPEVLTTTAPATLTLTYDGTNWTSSSGTVVGGSSTQVGVDLNGSGSADITANLSKTASAGDTITLGLTGSDDWTPQTTADIDNNGYYDFGADFIGGTDTGQNIALDTGVKWNGSTFVPDSLSTTQYASASTTVYQSADGYGAGALQGVSVSTDGLITGTYSNGQVLPLYKIALAKFQSNQGLQKIGGNLYTETRQSGPATTSTPGTNGLGSISPDSLEQSNVDIANEFVKMITTQRGFQANSKIITVTDQMLSELINMQQ